MATDVKSEGSSDFDFMGADEKTKVAGTKSETATSGNPELGVLNLATVTEARKRADSPAGLDIAAFMEEFKLVSMDTEHVLNGPLPKE